MIERAGYWRARHGRREQWQAEPGHALRRSRDRRRHHPREGRRRRKRPVHRRGQDAAIEGVEIIAAADAAGITVVESNPTRGARNRPAASSASVRRPPGPAPRPNPRRDARGGTRGRSPTSTPRARGRSACGMGRTATRTGGTLWPRGRPCRSACRARAQGGRPRLHRGWDGGAGGEADDAPAWRKPRNHRGSCRARRHPGVGLTERFNPAAVAALPFVSAPEVRRGAPARYFPERSLDIDVIFDLMIHDLDLLLTSVAPRRAGPRGGGVNVLTPKADIANARIRFAS